MSTLFHMSLISQLELKLAHNFWFLPPDIHERQRFIASLVKPGQKILDVGGEQRILGEVAQASDYYTINVADEGNQTPAHLQRTTKDLYYDGKHLPFKDKEFDVVVCVDVLEHVPKPQRTALIKEMRRVAKYQLICSAPFGTDEHITAEKKLYQHLIDQKKEAAFLKEHIERGLPTPDEVEQWRTTFDGKTYFSGDFRWSNKMYTFHNSEVRIPGLNHLYFFFKLAVYAACNLILYPFIVGKKQYTAFSNRFYLVLS